MKIDFVTTLVCPVLLPVIVVVMSYADFALVL